MAVVRAAGMVVGCVCETSTSMRNEKVNRTGMQTYNKKSVFICTCFLIIKECSLSFLFSFVSSYLFFFCFVLLFSY